MDRQGLRQFADRLPLTAALLGLGNYLVGERILGLAAMMLAVQALQPATLSALRLNLVADTSQHAVPTALAAVVVVVLFALSRAGRGTR